MSGLKKPVDLTSFSKAELVPPPVTSIYITSRQGYANYCEGCDELAKLEELDMTQHLCYRIHCKAPKCRK